MNVVGFGKLVAFLEAHEDARPPLVAWLREAAAAEWGSPAEIRARYSRAKFIPPSRVIFSIQSNLYVLDTKVYYTKGVVLIVRAGTSAESTLWRF